jgi:hypothetical protein
LQPGHRCVLGGKLVVVVHQAGDGGLSYPRSRMADVGAFELISDSSLSVSVQYSPTIIVGTFCSVRYR